MRLKELPAAVSKLSKFDKSINFSSKYETNFEHLSNNKAKFSRKYAVRSMFLTSNKNKIST